jgi:hypothetical protein
MFPRISAEVVVVRRGVGREANGIGITMFCNREKDRARLLWEDVAAGVGVEARWSGDEEVDVDRGGRSR